MIDAYVSEIGIFSFGYAPPGWTECDGRLLAIDAHQPLFSLVGWRYGGDGFGTFGLPDLRSGQHGGATARPMLCMAVDGLYPQRPRTTE